MTIEMQSTTCPLGQAVAGAPQVIRLGSTAAVVLGTTAAGLVEVWQQGQIRTHSPGTPADPADPVAAPAMAVQALRGVAAARRATITQVQAQALRHAIRLDEIRDYAVNAHLDGSICYDGLNQFLRTFDLAEFTPNLRLEFTIAGGYLVTGTDMSAARRDGESTLTADFSQVDDVVDESDDFTAVVETVRPVSWPGGATEGLVVAFAITGSYEVCHDSSDIAVDDGAAYLAVGLQDTAGVVEGSLGYRVEITSVERCA